jgi:ribosomal protein S27AE
MGPPAARAGGAANGKEPRMWRDDPRPHWQELADEAFTGMTTWRAAHPTATWAEIEAALEERLAALRGRMLQDAAQASAASDFRGAAAAARPRCPECGAALVAVGQERRHLTTAHERPISLERTRGRCPACGAGVFPPR